MQVFVFYSEKDGDIAAFTNDQDGQNLPAEFAPWKPLGGGAMRVGDNLAGASGRGNAVMDGIARDGFFLARAELRTIHSPLPRRNV
jgi:hypothetical protein